MTKRVVITGMGALSPIGNDWDAVKLSMLAGQNGIKKMDGWDEYESLRTCLGAPVAPYYLPSHYTRKKIRSMGKVALYATLASEKALIDAGLLGDDIITNGQTGIAYGSSTGTPESIADFGRMLANKTIDEIKCQQLYPHDAAYNDIKYRYFFWYYGAYYSQLDCVHIG